MADQNLGSTNIADLVNNESDTNDEIVNKILDELEDNDSDDFGDNSPQYNMDNMNMNNMDMDNMDMDMDMDNMDMDNSMNMDKSMTNSLNMNNFTDNLSIENLCNIFKYPLAVFIITLAVNNHISIQHFLNIKFLQSDDNTLNIIGYVIQAFIISILFLITNQFILINI